MGDIRRVVLLGKECYDNRLALSGLQARVDQDYPFSVTRR